MDRISKIWLGLLTGMMGALALVVFRHSPSAPAHGPLGDVQPRLVAPLGGSLCGTTAAGCVNQIDGTAGTATIAANTLQFGAGTTPLVSQATAASDVATADIHLLSQAPFASAVTNLAAGGFNFEIPAGVGAGGQSYFKFKSNGAIQWYMGPLAYGNSYGTLWPQGVTPAAGNYALTSGAAATDTRLNAATGGTVGVYINNAQIVNVSAAAITLGVATTASSTLAVAGAVSGVSGTNAFNWKTFSQSYAAGGVITLTSVQYNAPYQIMTGSLAGNTTIVFPATVGACWQIDATAVTLNAHTITAQANSNAWATTIGITNIYQVCYGGTGKLYGMAMTP